MILAGCGVKAGSSSFFQVPLNPTKCQHLPAEAIIDPATQCTTTSGNYTAYSLIAQSHRVSGSKYCNINSRDYPPANQFQFDYRFTSELETSDNDYFFSASCSSGSTFLNTSGGGYFRILLWEKAP